MRVSLDLAAYKYGYQERSDWPALSARLLRTSVFRACATAILPCQRSPWKNALTSFLHVRGWRVQDSGCMSGCDAVGLNMARAVFAAGCTVLAAGAAECASKLWHICCLVAPCCAGLHKAHVSLHGPMQPSWWSQELSSDYACLEDQPTGEC